MRNDTVIIVEGFVYCYLDCEIVGCVERVGVCVVGFSLVVACRQSVQLAGLLTSVRRLTDYQGVLW